MKTSLTLTEREVNEIRSRDRILEAQLLAAVCRPLTPWFGRITAMALEKVQFQLETTVPELKDLHEKKLFSKVSFHRAQREGNVR